MRRGSLEAQKRMSKDSEITIQMTGRTPTNRMQGSFDDFEEPDESQKIYIKDLECGSVSIIFSVM